MDSVDARLTAIVDLWTQQCAGRPLPNKADLTTADLAPWLENIAWIELNDVGDGTFRRCGRNLVVRFGADITDCRVVALSDDLVATFLVYIARVREARAPFHDIQDRRAQGALASFHDLSLPLSEDSTAKVRSLLFASYRRG